MTATATDEDGTFHSNSLQVRVTDQPPMVRIDGASTCLEGDRYVIDLIFEDAGTDVVVEWLIDWGDGVPVAYPGSATEAGIVFDDGDTPVLIQATAVTAEGSFVSNSLPVQILNVAPTLLISGSTAVQEGGEYTLSLSSSDPGEDTISSWRIDWGDGTHQTVDGTTETVTHTFLDGDATVRIGATAIDEDGSWQSNTIDVHVLDVPPVLSLSGEPTVHEGSVYELTLQATDPGDDTVSDWRIDWGDGRTETISVTGEVTTALHLYRDGDNTTQITATAINEDGEFAADPFAILVANVAPTLTISGGLEVDEGSEYELTLLASDPGEDTIVEWVIDWGDGTTDVLVGPREAATHTFADGTATRTITASARDEDGVWHSNSVEVLVRNVPPQIRLDAPSELDEGNTATVSFGLAEPDPGADEVLSWEVHWSDGTVQPLSSDASTASRQFGDGPDLIDVFVVALTDDGAFESETRSIAIRNVPPTLGLSGPSHATAGQEVTFTLSSSDPGEDTITHWTIDWGDGVIEHVDGNPTEATHTYRSVFDAVVTATATDEDGTWSAGPHYVDVQGVTLIEDDRFLTEWSTTLTIPTGDPAAPWALQIDLLDLVFDTEDRDEINDSFELALLDSQNRPLVPPILQARDAFFNATEEQTVQVGAGTVYDDGRQQVTVDLSGLAAGEEVTLVARLIGTDDDTSTRVSLNPAVNFVQSPLTDPTTNVPFGYIHGRPGERIDVDLLSDVTQTVSTEYGLTTYDTQSTEVRAELSLENSGPLNIRGPVLIVIDDISEASVRPDGYDGRTPDGRVYYDVTSLLKDDRFRSDDRLDGFELLFENPRAVQFDYSVEILGQLNAAPEFTTEPHTEVAAGNTWTYDSDAVDLNGDDLQYELILGPTGLEIDAGSGEMTWSTNDDDLGNHSVVIEVRDPEGLTDRQAFTLTVRDPARNRPPVWTTDPVVDAFADQDYLYESNAFDADGDQLRYELIEGPDGLSIDPASGKARWTPLSTRSERLFLSFYESSTAKADGAINPTRSGSTPIR